MGPSISLHNDKLSVSLATKDSNSVLVTKHKNNILPDGFSVSCALYEVMRARNTILKMLY